MLTNYNNILKEVSKKFWKKFKINFRKIAIKLLKKKKKNVIQMYMEKIYLLSLFSTYFRALRICYNATHSWTISSSCMRISMISCQEGVCAKMRFFLRAVQSFLTSLHCVIITSLWSYLKLQSATQHEKHAVFDVTIHFPKFSFILILQFIQPFGIGVYTCLSITTYEQSL